MIAAVLHEAPGEMGSRQDRRNEVDKVLQGLARGTVDDDKIRYTYGAMNF
jgi:hypothetical protein